MRKTMAAALVVSISIGGWTATAGADGSDHNCAGAVSSEFAKQLGSGFGAIVSAAAQEQLVDNFGLRNCGAAKGRNP